MISLVLFFRKPGVTPTTKKKKREIAPALTNISSFNKRDMSQGAK
jgi:hypothetical protein